MSDQGDRRYEDEPMDGKYDQDGVIYEEKEGGRGSAMNRVQTASPNPRSASRSPRRQSHSPRRSQSGSRDERKVYSRSRSRDRYHRSRSRSRDRYDSRFASSRYNPEPAVWGEKQNAKARLYVGNLAYGVRLSHLKDFMGEGMSFLWCHFCI